MIKNNNFIVNYFFNKFLYIDFFQKEDWKRINYYNNIQNLFLNEDYLNKNSIQIKSMKIIQKFFF